MERTDDYGTWSSDDGTTWTLTTPSQAWLDAQRPEQTPRETLVTYLDQMTDEQAAPVLTVLGWIATLTPEQAAALTVTLATLITQGDPPMSTE